MRSGSVLALYPFPVIVPRRQPSTCPARLAHDDLVERA